MVRDVYDVYDGLGLFPHGPHGLGLALDQTNEVRGWSGRLLTWLREQWGEG